LPVEERRVISDQISAIRRQGFELSVLSFKFRRREEKGGRGIPLYAARRAIRRRGRENWAAPLGMTTAFTPWRGGSSVPDPYRGKSKSKKK
jgi:hypothetical protein